MKRLFLSLLLFLFISSPALCRVKVIFEEDDISQPEEIVEETVKEEIPQEETAETKIIDDDTIYLDIDNYEKNRLMGKVFQLQIEQNEELLHHKMNSERIKIQTDYTITDIGQSKFNNKTTIFSKTMTNTGVLFPNLSIGCGSEIKEFMPLPDTTNYSTLSTSLYADYKLKFITLEGEFERTNNVATDTYKNYFSFGPKINITKSSAIKSTITRDFNSDTIYGELAFIYKPIKSKRDMYLEINAWSSNAQYNVTQQRFQIYGKIKI